MPHVSVGVYIPSLYIATADKFVPEFSRTFHLISSINWNYKIIVHHCGGCNMIFGSIDRKSRRSSVSLLTDSYFRETEQWPRASSIHCVTFFPGVGGFIIADRALHAYTLFQVTSGQGRGSEAATQLMKVFFVKLNEFVTSSASPKPRNKSIWIIF